MVNGIKNCFLVNSPAGSGKTTSIKAKLKEHTINHPKDNVLCITYTNRAVDELLKDVSSSNVFISTIHSFLHEFMSPYFYRKEVLQLYFDQYADKITERIESTKKNIIESNKKYSNKHGELNVESIRNNIKSIYYNELPFDSVLYGGLSHDGLIKFSKVIIDRYPIIKKRISSKYQLIFIDEYQDTSADVLKLFYDCVINSNAKLYLFGDRMQQIYGNYDGSFENELALFNKTEELNINRRSSDTIINLLNNIYNDENYKQQSQTNKNRATQDITPKLFICNDLENTLKNFQVMEKDFLVLYLLNEQRFNSIGAKNIYSAFNKMEKYSFGKKHNVVDVLSSKHDDNPDTLMKLLFLLIEIYHHYKNNHFSLILKEVKKYPKIFDNNTWNIKEHSDKIRLHNHLQEVFTIFLPTGSIQQLLSALDQRMLIKVDYLNAIKEDEEYKDVLNTSIKELFSLNDYLKDPKVSTQHGVKGESHNNVIFVAYDSSSLFVKMYDFFKLWSSIELSLKKLQEIYYQYITEIAALEKKLGFKISALERGKFNSENRELLVQTAKLHQSQFSENDIFNATLSDKYNNFLNRQTIENAKSCFKASRLSEIINAYKLFYVGCSRARNEIIVLLDQNKMDNQTLEKQKDKFKSIGFEIIEDVIS